MSTAPGMHPRAAPLGCPAVTFIRARRRQNQSQSRYSLSPTFNATMWRSQKSRVYALGSPQHVRAIGSSSAQRDIGE